MTAVGQNTAGAAAESARKGATTASAQRPNVILITIDTLRADHVGCYGAREVKTPTLDSLAADGVVFERAIAQVPLTWPSHAVILTGTYPFQNGVQDFTGQPLGPQFRSVAQAFHDAGYATGAVVSAFVLDRSWGLARGFDYYDDAFSAKTFAEKDVGLVDRPASESVGKAIAWLKRRTDKNIRSTRPGADKRVLATQSRPVFLWLHLYDPHSPYNSPEPYRTEYNGHPYDGAIAYADHELGNLITWLKMNRLYDSSLIVMLSDHGESLGEHGEAEHGFFIYNATVHVPLIVKPAAGSGIKPGRRGEVVETAAVAPTLLGIADAKGIDPIFEQFQVHALLGPRRYIGSERQESGPVLTKDPVYSETFYPFSSFGWSPLHAMETERFQFIDAPKPELYDLVSDPGETKNIAEEQPATVAVLREKLQTLLAHNPSAGSAGGAGKSGAGNLSPEAQAKLRALGYFGFRAAVSPEELEQGLADPKDKLWEFHAILKATDALGTGNTQEGEALLAKVEEQDPKLYVVPFMIGEAELRRENWEGAAAELKRCLELNPNFDNAMTGLALALGKMGRTEEAKTWLDRAIAGNAQNYRAWYQKGLLEAESDSAAAKAAYEKTVEIQPNFSPGQRALGMIFFEQKKYAAAAAHLEKALALGMNDARIHNYLGICYAQTKRLARAIEEHRRAVELDPKLAEAHLNLGFDYERTGRDKEAQAEYEAACRLSEPMCRLVEGRRKAGQN